VHYHACAMNLTEQKNVDKVIIGPAKLNYGVVSAGFLYNYKFTVQNNTKSPMRIRIACSPLKGESNTIRLVHLPNIIAPGLATTLFLELTAEYPMSSRFLLSVTQNHSDEVYTKEIEANVVSTETFKHVKKSLVLQKRPIYQPNVKVVANIPDFDTMGEDLHNYSSSATFTEAALLDEDDINDLLSLPMVHNVYWDPFAKCLRLDPKLGKIEVDGSSSLEDNKAKTQARREERMVELEEQGFLTINSLARMREDQDNAVLMQNSHISQSADYYDQVEAGSVGGSVGGGSATGGSVLGSVATEEEGITRTDTNGDFEDDDEQDPDEREAEDDDTFSIPMVQTYGDSPAGSFNSPTRLRLGSAGGVGFSEEDQMGRSQGSVTSTASRASVASLIAIKRERIERQRRESVQLSSSFTENSKNDSKIDKNRTLTMIKGRANVKAPVTLSDSKSKE